MRLCELPSAGVVRELLHYNPESGEFRWRRRAQHWFKSEADAKRWNGRAGKPAGNLRTTKHNRRTSRWISVLNNQYPASTLAWIYMRGRAPKGVVDHIDHNSLNDAWDNLREVSNAKNMQNKSRYRNNKSGVTGVVRAGKKCVRWRAMIRDAGVLKHLGSFEDFFEAVCARKSAERKLGFHTNHGS